MLVAGTAMSLIAPIGVQASEVNLDDMNSYSGSNSKSKRFDSKTFINEISEDLAILKGRVDGLEAQQNNLEAGSFSDTTTLDGKAIMWVGGVDGGDKISGQNSVQTGYTYTMNLNTSFTGDDNLYVRLKGGEQGDQWKNKSTYHIETKDTSDAFKVDKIWYTFNIGEDLTAFVGPRIENYYMYITPSIYQPGVLKSMKLGGNSNFGASTDVGFGFKWENDAGLGIASNIVSKEADGSGGLLGTTDWNKWDTQLAYTQDNWHASVTMSRAQNWDAHSYNATSLAAAMGINGSAGSADTVGFAYRAYWRPDDAGSATPEVSVGYDTKSLVGDFGPSGTAKEADSYFVGLTWRDMFQADDRIGVAFTQPLKVTEVTGGGATSEVDPFVWEAYYSFRPNDSVEIRPAIFGGTDVFADTSDDIFGAAVTTVFKF